MAPIDGIQSKDILIHASPIAGRPVLFEGQTVSGRVLAVSDKGAVVNLGGFKVLAQSNTPLTEGLSIKVKVEQVTDEKVVLKLIEKTADTSFTLQKLDDSDIEQVLLKLGLAEDIKNLAFAKALISAGIPVNRENILSLAGLAQKFNISDNQSLKLLALMIGRDIPVSSESLRALSALLNSEPIGSLAQRLAGLLGGETGPGGQTENAVALLRDALIAYIGNLKFGGAGDIKSGITGHLDNLAYETRLAQLFKDFFGSAEIKELMNAELSKIQQIIQRIDKLSLKDLGLPANILDQAGRIAAGSAQNNLSDIGSLERLSALLLRVINGVNGNYPSESKELTNSLSLLRMYIQSASEGGKSTNAPAENLKYLLLLLQQASGSAGNAVSGATARALSGFSDNILGQQLVNGSVDMAPKPLNVYYLQIPYVIDNLFETLEIAIKGDDTKNKKIDPENTNIVFLLSMPNIGKVRIQTLVQGKNMDCRFMVENQAVKDLVEANANELVDSISGLTNKEFKLDCVVEKIPADAGGENNAEKLLLPVAPKKVDVIA